MSRFVLLVLLCFVSGRVLAELPVQSRELQRYWVKDGYQIAIDNDPAWLANYLPDEQAPAFQATTPELYYPPAVITVKLHKGITVNGDQEAMRDTALAALQAVLAKVNPALSLDAASLLPVAYGELHGYAISFMANLDGLDQETSITIARNRTGQVMSLEVTTLPGKLPHIEAAANRVWQNIRFVSRTK